MRPQTLSRPHKGIIKVEPECPYFGTCGGCAWQDIPYSEELAVKEQELRAALSGKFELEDEKFEPIVASPEEYHYRNRLDLSFRKTRNGEYLLGFKPEATKYIVPIESCAIACREISDFIPKLKNEIIQRLTPKYRTANVTVRTDASGRIFWGGIGRRSLEMMPRDYFWIEVNGLKIFYSLDTFFQANLSILPRFLARLRSLPLWSQDTVFYDLYAGVGLFGFALQDLVGKVVMVEESAASIRLARYNAAYHRFSNVHIIEGKVEEMWGGVEKNEKSVALIDPPRKGLSDTARAVLTRAKDLEALLYVSCHPKSLVEDMSHFVAEGWRIEKVMPFDFFPKTKHLETLVWLNPGSQGLSPYK